MYTLTFNGQDYINWDKSSLLSAGVPESMIAEAKYQAEWSVIKEQRSPLLVEADYLVNKAEDLGRDAAPFRAYRQALRDIPQTYQNAGDVVWPTKPSLQSA